jgi:hypothetical protein
MHLDATRLVRTTARPMVARNTAARSFSSSRRKRGSLLGSLLRLNEEADMCFLRLWKVCTVMSRALRALALSFSSRQGSASLILVCTFVRSLRDSATARLLLSKLPSFGSCPIGSASSGRAVGWENLTYGNAPGHAEDSGPCYSGSVVPGCQKSAS